MDCVYKIKNEDGLFSDGKCRPRWSKKGIVFRSKQQLAGHLRAVMNANRLTVYNGCMLLTFKLEISDDVLMDEIVEDMLIKKCIEILRD